MLTESQFENTVPAELVERQLIRIQSSSHFNHSRRYPSFLSYVVRKTLIGRQEELKERTIGVEVFGRQPGYDLNADPVVRVTAGEVRKRLAQYYYEPEHLEEPRIELRPGSYIPEFKLAPGQGVVPGVEMPTLQDASPQLPEVFPLGGVPPLDETAQPNDGIDRTRRRNRHKRLVFGLAGSLLLIASALFAGSYLRTSAVNLFWRPLLTSHEPILISVGSVVALASTTDSAISDASVGGHPLHSDPVALSDTIALAKLQEVLSGHHRVIDVESSAQTSFSDLRRGPIILISGFNNPWTMRLTDPLRFHLVRPGVDTFEIDDRADPKRKWSVNTLAPLNKVSDDYGLIARFYDPVTEQVVVVAAGIGENGTIAAAEALSDERSLEGLKHSGLMPQEKGNFEAVVQVRMIDGKPGPPKIVATNLW